MDNDRLRALAEIRTWIGTPWVHQGRLKGKRGGVDCIGLVLALAAIAGISPETVELPDNYSRFPHRGELRRAIETHMHKVPLADAKVCDVALVAWQAFPTHLIILGNYQHSGVGAPFSAIHAENTLTANNRRDGSVVECRFDSPSWACVGIYRFPGW